jgi:hypothetical protein
LNEVNGFFEESTNKKVHIFEHEKWGEKQISSPTFSLGKTIP